MTVTAPTGLWLNTLPLVPNNKNQLATFLSDVATAVNAMAAGTASYGTASAYPTGTVHMVWPNLDSDIDANWGVTQSWFDNGLARKDTMLLIGYNFNAAQGRSDLTEPAFGLQMESQDVASDEVTPCFAWHFSFLDTDDNLFRPITGFIQLTGPDAGVSDTSFVGRNQAFYGQGDTTTPIAHFAKPGAVHAVGIRCVANTNILDTGGIHVKGVNAWENPTGTANDTLWRWMWNGDTLQLETITDAIALGGRSIWFNRVAGVPKAVGMTLQTFANNGLAAAGGLVIGELYQTAAGEVRVVVA